jgi:hypothetical protein
MALPPLTPTWARLSSCMRARSATRNFSFLEVEPRPSPRQSNQSFVRPLPARVRAQSDAIASSSVHLRARLLRNTPREPCDDVASSDTHVGATVTQCAAETSVECVGSGLAAPRRQSCVLGPRRMPLWKRALGSAPISTRVASSREKRPDSETRLASKS